MTKEWLSWINMTVAGISGLLLLVAFFLFITQNNSIESPETVSFKSQGPVSSFQLPQSSYDAIGKAAFSLESSPIVLQLPDLKKTLLYNGKNSRPDADATNTPMYLGFIGAKVPTAILPNTKTYLLYNKRQSPPRYEFSPENAETSLWIDVYADGAVAVVNVHMKDDKGAVVTTPKANAQFSLAEKPFMRTDASAWEIGKQRVDGTLLARQRARWYGVNRFLEKHGGKEYQDLVGKQRIDFGENKSFYAIYMQAGDVAIWENDRWSTATPGERTLGKPLIVVKKVDERLMTFEVWDSEGKTKIALNLLKSSEPPPAAQLMQSFKFVSSRTRSQFVFEVNKERMTLSPLDWLLQVDKGWKKLSSVDEIDAYVDRKLVGPLFIFEGVTKRGESQVLVGTLFNKARSDFIPIEMVMDAGENLSPAAPNSHHLDRIKGQADEMELDDNERRDVELHPHTRKEMR